MEKGWQPVWLLVGGCAVSAASAAFAGAPVPIFADGFESGNTLAWTMSVGEPSVPPATALRISDLDLRDPHVSIDVPVVGCSDFTDQPLPFGLAPALNVQIETAITTDGDSDGWLDLSTLVLLRPWDPVAAGERMDLAGGECAAPFPPAACGLPAEGIPQTTSYVGLAAGACLEVVPGTTSGYVPAVATATGPCVLSAARPMVFDLGQVVLPLHDVQLAATPVDAAPSGLVGGLMRGFLRETDADATPIPATVPVVGGQPLSILLPGGTGNCSAGDDRDTHLGEPGWWFYFAFTADAVVLQP